VAPFHYAFIADEMPFWFGGTMINHILVPLDGSALAECVLPHVMAIAPVFEANITLLHILELPSNKGDEQAIDPLEWHLKKREAGVYLDGIAARLRHTNLKVKDVILEGLPAECVIDFANNNDVDLIALSTHGRSGLSGWNVSSVVQKIILRSFKSTLLIRAYKSSGTEFAVIRYNRLFVGLDCSTRAEYILPVAIGLAQFYNAQLILGSIIRKPEMLHRFPLSDDDVDLVNRIADRNYSAASHYFEQIHSQLSLRGVDLQTRLVVSNNMTAALHDMVEQENADLVLLVAHGHSGEVRWPYGSIASSFIAYGTTSLMIMQDLSGDEIKRTQAEMAVRETKGH
jgi:nucleotide-binding universal stress UspA family protein